MSQKPKVHWKDGFPEVSEEGKMDTEDVMAEELLTAEMRRVEMEAGGLNPIVDGTLAVVGSDGRVRYILGDGDRVFLMSLYFASDIQEDAARRD